MKRTIIFAIAVLCVTTQNELMLAQESSDEVIRYEIKKEVDSSGAKHVVSITKDGETKVFNWNGEGEMPAEMKSHMDEIEGVMISDGDDEDARSLVIKRDVHRGGKPHHKYRLEKWDHNIETPKVRLGIMMDDGDEGVRVTDVFKGTAADEAGLEKDDIILKIDDHYIFTGGSLLKALGNYEIGDEVRIIYLRDDKEMEATGKLTERQ